MSYTRIVEHFREAGVLLPTFAQLADPSRIPPAIRERLVDIDPNDPHPLNLFRVHWFNDADPGAELRAIPATLELPQELTGVSARIVIALGDHFPLIGAHKVLPAYACLIPRLIAGGFDPTQHRAVWPSTGNYCRGGVAISRILGCRGVAVLPEGMSSERFEWLERWVFAEEDIVRTPGTESNVKEIYDRCDQLEKDPRNQILNQFSEFGNHLAHYACTGRALSLAFDEMSAQSQDLSLTAFVASSGSAGTLGAGDYLKDRYGSRTVAVEALECPTMLYNGFGEHNIQGIGDKHIPLIHNVLNTDYAIAVSDRATDGLDLVFQTDVGREYLRRRRGVEADLVAGLDHLGLSSICNILAAIKLAHYLNLGCNDVIMTVATDGAALYVSERRATARREHPLGFDEIAAAETFGRHMLGAASDHLLELGARDRDRIFNLGYYTWVEQRGVSIDAFEARRKQSFWRGLRGELERCDEHLVELNRATGLEPAAE